MWQLGSTLFDDMKLELVDGKRSELHYRIDTWLSYLEGIRHLTSLTTTCTSILMASTVLTFSVYQVVPGSPGDVAGLEPYFDYIVAINGELLVILQ